MDLIVIAAAVLGLVGTTVFLLLAPAAETSEDRIQRRLDNVGKRAAGAVQGSGQPGAGFWAQIAEFFLGHKAAGGPGDSQLRRLLYQGGYPAENAVRTFWGVRFTLMVLLGGLGALWAIASAAPLPRLLVNVAVGILAGFIVPHFVLQRKATRRKLQVKEALPDTLDLLVVCTEAGMGLDAAFVRVGNEQGNSGLVIGDEFRLMAREVQAGASRREAIARLADRLAIDEFRSLASFLIQTEEFGGSVARSLRVFAAQMREKRSQKAEELARKAVIKLIFPVVLFILPALFLVALAPVSVSIMTRLIK